MLDSNYYTVSEEMWSFLHGIYGGGPCLPLTTSNVAPSSEEDQPSEDEDSDNDGDSRCANNNNNNNDDNNVQ